MNIDFDFSKIKIIPLIDTIKLVKISDEEYFSNNFSNYISNSRLGLLKSKGAKAFFEGLKNDNEFNGSFAFGTLLHTMCLQPEDYEVVEGVYKPTAKAGIVADYLYNPDGTPPSDDEIRIASIKCNYYKNKLTPNRMLEFKNKAEPYWRDRFIFEQNNPQSNKTRIYTDAKSYELMNSCLNSLNSNKDIQNLLHPSGITEDPIIKNEFTLLMDIEVSIEGYNPVIYKLKSKLDNFSIDKESELITVNDLKTTSKLANEFSPEYFSYQREIAMYSWLLKTYVTKEYGVTYPVKGNFLVVSIVPEYNSLVYPMTPKLYKNGFEEFKYLLKTVAYLNIVKGYKFNNEI